MSKTNAKSRASLIHHWNDLSHMKQKTIVIRNHPLFAKMLEKHNLIACDSCFDLFVGDDCPRCEPHCQTRFNDVNAEISRERDLEIYASVR